MSKIALVGLGWLGLPLAQSLKNKGFDICGTTTSASKLDSIQSLGIDARILNLNSAFDQQEFKEFFSTVSVCILSIPPSKTLFQSYQNQCLQLVTLFPDTCKFIFTSSTSVYADNCKLAEENSKILSDYNFTSQLFLTEKALQKELGNQISILRLAGLFGENRNPAKFLSGKKDLKNPDAKVNLVHQQDVISFIETLIEQNVWGEIFNVCASNHPTRKEFYTWKCEQDMLALPEFENTDQKNTSKEVSNQKGKDQLNFKYKFDSPYDF
jgi:nucleoside-diphosphate-sugar epimerase